MFGVEGEISKESYVVFVNCPKLRGDVVLGVDYLKIDSTKFFVLDKFNDLEEFLVFDENRVKFGKIAVAQNKIVSFEDFVFWFGGNEYKIVAEKMFIVRVDDKAVLEQELAKRTNFLLKMFEKYLK